MNIIKNPVIRLFRRILENKNIQTAIFFAAIFSVFSVSGLFAQALNWQGQTGAFITPFAYNSPSKKNKLGRPNVGFHYLSGGEVVGDNYQTSITFGAFNRAEFGYTRTFTKTGNTPGLSPLFGGGFNTVHGKVNIVPENVKKNKLVPAISVGFVVRSQVRRVGGRITNQDTVNGDLYVVGTKTITKIEKLPIVLNLGIKATNASLMGLAGNASAWQGRMFGAAAVVLPGPAKSKLVVGSEFSQEPRHIKNLDGATVPTSMTYFVRVLPLPEKPFNIDFGIAQAAGKIAPGVDVKARNRFAMGVSYRF